MLVSHHNIFFILLVTTVLTTSLLLVLQFASAQQRPTARSTTSHEDAYYGSWRHVPLPKSIRRPLATTIPTHIDNDTCQSELAIDALDDLTDEEKSQKKDLNAQTFKEKLHFLSEPGSFDLDFEISDVKTLLESSATRRTPLTFKSKNNNAVSGSDLGCSARFISSKTETDDITLRALEVSCERLNVAIQNAIDEQNKEKQRLLKEQEEEQAKAKNNNKKNNNNKRRRAKTSVDFDPSIPTFRFLNYDEASVQWPIARVSTVLARRSMREVAPGSSFLAQQQQQQASSSSYDRLFEGVSSTCIETDTSVTALHPKKTDSKKDDAPPRNPLSRIATLVPLHQSKETSTFISIDQLLKTAKNEQDSLSLFVKVKMVPIGNRNPTSRQLIRWMKYVTPAENLLQKVLNNKTDEEISDDEQDELDYEEERKQIASLKKDKSLMFELRPTEKRLTRLGTGFRARLRRNIDNDDEYVFKNTHDLKKYRKRERNHLPVFTNWSIEIFRRVPRPQLECVSVFSRLLDFPEMYKASTAKKAQNVDDDDDEDEHNGDGAEKTKDEKKKKNKKYQHDDDDFDDDDDYDDDSANAALDEEELKLKRKRERIKKLLTKKEHNAAVPTREEIENAKMRLVASHQLRGMLDPHFTFPEFSKHTPLISVPASPAPNLLESEADLLAARKRPPQGMYVLYISEERPREQIVDVEINHADYQFVAPLKIEKKVLNMTFKGEYERLAIPRPPITNWTWFDTKDVPLVSPTQITQHKKLDPRRAAQLSSPEVIHEQQMLDSRGTLPRLMFQYRNHSLFPGFSVLVEQNRPIDDLQIWITDGKNDTLFLDEEHHVPFTVPSHKHDPIDRPLFGWRLALDSQRVIALDTLHITFAFNYRRSEKFDDYDDDDEGEDFGRRRNGNNNPSTSDYLSALSRFNAGKEAAKHLISWVDEHRWIPIYNNNNMKNHQRNASSSSSPFLYSPTDSLINPAQQGLPFFTNYNSFRRRLFGSSSTDGAMMNGKYRKLHQSVALEQDVKNSNQWRLVANRDFEKSGEDVFTLPWSSTLRHSEAPNWILELVTSSDFEQEILKKHEQFLVANDHVDLLASEEGEGEGIDDASEQQQQQQEDSSSSSSYLNRIRKTLKNRRRIAFDNAKAWTILTLMHWAQTEPELSSSASQQQESHARWGTETTSTRWHSHYRMFNERVKTDAARRLRKFVLSHVNNGLHPKDERANIPSSSWCPLTESLQQRSSFLHDAAAFFLEHHPALPGSFGGGEIGATDWFTSAYTIIEARSLLVSTTANNKPKSEWIYVPLLDLATPGVKDANVELSLSRAVQNTNTLALRVSLGKGMKFLAKGTPFIFNGWSGSGFRSAVHGLELFGFLSEKMGFAETVTPLLPYGPILHNNVQNAPMMKKARNTVLDECRARCQRVSEGRTVSMHDDGLLLKEKSESTGDDLNIDDRRDDGMLLTEEETQQYLLHHRQQQKKMNSIGALSSSNNNNNDNTHEPAKCCCNLQWLDAKLRRRWKQIAANELLWNLPREILKRQMWAVSKVPSENFDKSFQKERNVVALRKEPEPPLWKISRQYLISSARKTLEAHIGEIAEEMKKSKIPRIPALRSMPEKLSGLNTKELVVAAFGDEDSSSSSSSSSDGNSVLKKDAPIESYLDEDLFIDDEVRWFSCCKKNGVVEDESSSTADETLLSKE